MKNLFGCNKLKKGKFQAQLKINFSEGKRYGTLTPPQKIKTHLSTKQAGVQATKGDSRLPTSLASLQTLQLERSLASILCSSIGALLKPVERPRTASGHLLARIRSESTDLPSPKPQMWQLCSRGSSLFPPPGIETALQGTDRGGGGVEEPPPQFQLRKAKKGSTEETPHPAWSSSPIPKALRHPGPTMPRQEQGREDARRAGRTDERSRHNRSGTARPGPARARPRLCNTPPGQGARKEPGLGHRAPIRFPAGGRGAPGKLPATPLSQPPPPHVLVPGRAQPLPPAPPQGQRSPRPGPSPPRRPSRLVTCGPLPRHGRPGRGGRVLSGAGGGGGGGARRGAG